MSGAPISKNQAGLSNKRPKLLLATRNFPPLIGGMERLLFHVYKELVKDFNLYLVGPKGCDAYVELKANQVDSVAIAPIWRFLVHFQKETLQAAFKFRPDIVFSGSGLTAPATLLVARSIKKPSVSYLHGLDIVASSLLYRILFIPAIRRMDLLIVNSRNTAKLAQKYGIPERKIRILRPGVSMSTNNGDVAANIFRRRFGVEGKIILLSVGRLTARKGLAEFVSTSMPAIVRRFPNLCFIIIGDEAKQAVMKSGRQAKRIKDAAIEAGVEKDVILLGPVDDVTVEQAYFASDLFIFPLVDVASDVEGFGMVALEAAAHGLPTVAFNVGGVSDAIKDKSSGYLVEPGDYEEFTNIITNYFSKKPVSITAEDCKCHAAKYSWALFGAQLRKICLEAIN